jgi:sugar lactone lactonase YvrE
MRLITRYSWGGSSITRFSADGTVDVEIFFPTALNITACCFGGDWSGLINGNFTANSVYLFRF